MTSDHCGGRGRGGSFRFQNLPQRNFRLEEINQFRGGGVGGGDEPHPLPNPDPLEHGALTVIGRSLRAISVRRGPARAHNPPAATPGEPALRALLTQSLISGYSTYFHEKSKENVEEIV